MTTASAGPRVDVASRLIAAAPSAIYRALLDPEAVATWRPPAGMTARILQFDPREGGAFRMAFRYDDAGPGDGPARGKTSAREDIVRGRFAELALDRRVVELIDFESDDPAFAGTMTVVTTLTPAAHDTEVTIRCENVPIGISAADHQAGMASTLRNLADFVE